MPASPTLRQLRLEIYRDCPSGCRHCYQAQAEGAGAAPAALAADRRTFDRLVARFVELGGREISLSGGELLLPARWPFVRDLLLRLSRAGIADMRINSMLAFATRDMLSELADLPFERLRVQTGLDGETVHDFLRFAGAQAATLEALSFLAGRGIRRLSARTTLFFGHAVGERVLDNLGDLPAIVLQARAAGVPLLKTKAVHPSGMLAEENRAHRHLWESQEARLSSTLTDLVDMRRRGDTDMRFLFTNPLPVSALPALREAEREDPEGIRLERCGCGQEHLAIDGEGEVFRCLFNFGRPGLSLGNVRVRGIDAFLPEERRLDYVRGAAPGRCGAFAANLQD